MNIKKGTVIDVEIEKLAFGGRGIGRVDLDDTKKKYVVFVEGGIPGDKVKASLTKIKKSYGEARLKEVVKPSELRIEPKCKHFGECGGCALQNISYEDQLKIKGEQVKESLEKIGGLLDVKVNPVIPCDDPWNYRNKFEYSFDIDKEGKLNLGFHKKGMRYDLVDLKECYLGPEYVMDLLERLREGVEKGQRDFFARKKIPHKSLYFRIGKNTGEIMINLVVEQDPESSEIEAKIIKQEGEKFLATAQKWTKDKNLNLVSVYLTQIHRKRGQKTQVKEELLWGNPYLKEKMIVQDSADDIELNFQILPQAFFQPNTLQAQKLYKQVLEYADLKGTENVMDLYCGTGTISLFLAKKAKRVVGIEVVEDATKSAEENAKLNSIDNIKFLTGPVEKKLKDFMTTSNTANEHPDLIVVDPPRAGLSPKVVERVCLIHPKKVVYVSCNPTTLARDLAEFIKSGYKLKEVQPVDMFPHTYHIECVSMLTL